MDLNFYFYFLYLCNFFEICTNFKGFPMAQSQQHLEIIFLYLRESSKIKIALKIARKVKIDPLYNAYSIVYVLCLEKSICWSLEITIANVFVSGECDRTTLGYPPRNRREIF